jgi:hypothetical protein
MSNLRAKYKAARKPKPLTFADLSIGERFCNPSFPQGRVYQKISSQFAIDLSEGADRNGFFIKDRFSGTYPVMRKNDEVPQTVFDPLRLKTDN